MEVVRVSALPASIVLWQRGSGEWRLTVACKVTYALETGVSQPASKQLELHPADQYLEHDTARSVYAPNDFAPDKARADVVLTGSAFAPGGTPIKRLVAGMIVAEVNKSIAVHGWRGVGTDGNVQDGGPFTSMPLTYEHAAGGPGTDNPVGVRHDVRDSYGRITLPSLHKEDAQPGADVQVEPVGFGPLARDWPQRTARLGHHETDFDINNWRSKPLPVDFDMGYFNAAPPDQQVPSLKANEAIVLQNLHPEHSTFITKLSGVQPAVFLSERDGERLTMNPDTLWIDTDRCIATLTFRGQTSVSGPKESLCIVVAKEAPGQPIKWADARKLLRRARQRETVHTMDMPVGEETSIGFPHLNRRAAPLPFKASQSQPGPRPAESRADQADGALPFMSHKPAPAVDPLNTTSANWQLSRTPSPAQVAQAARVAPPAPAPSAPVAGIVPPPAPSSPGSEARPGPAASPWADGPASARPERAVPIVPRVANPLAEAKAPQSSISPALSPLPAPAVSPTSSADRLSLLWLHPECAPRVRRTKDFKPLFEELESRPVDWDLDDAAPAQDPMQLEDRREVFEVITRGDRKSEKQIRKTLQDSVRKDGKFVSPVVLIAAELSTPFDAKERLKATITTVTPLLPKDEDAEGEEADAKTETELSKAVADARSFLDNADELCPASVLGGFTQRITAAFEEQTTELPEGYLQDETQRVLLENRKYDTRIIFGETHLRTHAHLDSQKPPIVTYLPEDLAATLPLYARFRVRLIAEAHHQEDQYESHPIALRALALARILPPLPDE